MGFPIKKRVDCTNRGDCGPAPSGLDLLSAVIDACPASVVQPEPASSSSLGPPQAQGTIAPSLTRKSSEGDDEGSSAAPRAVPSPTAAPSRNKRSRPFPAILRDILSDPAHEPVVSWLPHGRSFAVHNTGAFSSQILPKHFRKVVFRSFARKLNRWGFRSVKKSVSGFESTFEHELFRRDEPELSRGMFCKSNPATTKGRAAVAAAAAGRAGGAGHAQSIPARPVPLQVQPPVQAVPLQTAPAQTHGQRPVISRSSSTASAAGAVPQSPGTMASLVAAAPALGGNRNEGFPVVPARPQGEELAARALRNALEEELAVRLRDELALRELQRRAREREREVEVLRFLRETPSRSDAVSLYIAEKLRCQLLEQQRGHGGY